MKLFGEQKTCQYIAYFVFGWYIYHWLNLADLQILNDSKIQKCFLLIKSYSFLFVSLRVYPDYLYQSQYKLYITIRALVLQVCIVCHVSRATVCHVLLCGFTHYVNTHKGLDNELGVSQNLLILRSSAQVISTCLGLALPSSVQASDYLIQWCLNKTFVSKMGTQGFA